MRREGDHKPSDTEQNVLRKSKKVVMKRLSRNGEERRSAYYFVAESKTFLSVVSLIFVPYLIGMLLMLLFFYFYLDIDITDFFHVYGGLSQLSLWFFGVYLIITVADIWLLSRKFIEW